MESKKDKILEVAEQTLRQANKALSPNKMYEIAKSFGLTDKLNLNGKTPWASFGARIYVDLNNNEKTLFEKVQDRPILIKLKDQILPKTELEEEPEEEAEEEKSTYKESELHQPLVDYLFANQDFKLRSKTINHQESQRGKRGQNEWLHPDIVGVRFEYEEFEKDVIDFTTHFLKKPLKIYSFELKVKLELSNLRQCYFQAVSNSSWANEGYLVSPEIDQSDDELMELAKKLNASFGIGIIKLDINEPASSEVLFRASYKENLDLIVINELCRINPNFKKFLNTIIAYDPNNSDRFSKEFEEATQYKG